MKFLKVLLPSFIVLSLGADVSALYAQTLPTSFSWSSTAALIGPKSDSTHNMIAVKDPSTVFYNGQYVVYASSVNSAGNYGMEYLHFSDWSQAGSATPYFMDSNPNIGGGYHTAPQVFYFAPQNKWYLIFQSGQPQFSTNSDPTQPQNWTTPKNFFASQPSSVSNWIDFWIISDSSNVYLFFCGDNGNFYRSSTSLANFPNGFNTPVIVYTDSEFNLFEADNVYTVEGGGGYLANIECIGSDGHRFFRALSATSLGGTWTPLGNTANLNSPFMGSHNVTFNSGVTNWTSDFSSGGAVIDGDDSTDSINLNNLTFLYQGDGPNSDSYNLIPWKLGLASSKANKTTSPTATPTKTNTPVPLTPTRTNTPVPPTASPTGTSTFTSTSTPTPVVSNTWRVNAGGPAYTDVLGHAWAADENFNGGTTIGEGTAITGTSDSTLYDTQRYGTFSYSFNVPAGSYQLTLKLAETYSGDTSVGARVFNVGVNGATVLTNLDIFSQVGANAADDQILNNVSAVNGVITIQFTGGTSTDVNALVEGIQIVPMSTVPTATATLVPPTLSPTRTATLTVTNTPTKTSTASFTATSTSTSTLSPTVTATRTATVVPPTATWTATSTMTAVPPTATVTSSATATFTLAPPTQTNTPAPPTLSPSPTRTMTGTDTPTWTNTATSSMTATPSLTASQTLSPTVTSTLTVTATKTLTPVPPTLTFTSTPVPPTLTFTAQPPTSTRTNTPVPPTATFTLTPVPPTNTPTVVVSGGAFKVQLLSGVTSDSTNSPHPQIQIVNTGTGPLSLNTVTVRYWLNCDCTNQTIQAWVDWAGLMPQGTTATGNVQVSVATTNLGGQTNYVLYSFTGNLVLQPGQSIQIQSRFNKSDWSNMLQDNDWSYAGYSAFTDWQQVTGYLNGTLVWGHEPAGVTPTLAVVAAPNVSTSNAPIQFQVALSNPGTINLYLYSVSGELVYHLQVAGQEGPNTLKWLLKNQASQQVASGLYLYSIQYSGPAGSTSRSGRVMVVH